MITQSFYLKVIETLKKNVEITEQSDFYQFTHPYVLVIHRPTKMGLYLDRHYSHLISVSDCQEPDNPIDIEIGLITSCVSCPIWAMSAKNSEFSSFWLY